MIRLGSRENKLWKTKFETLKKPGQRRVLAAAQLDVKEAELAAQIGTFLGDRR